MATTELYIFIPGGDFMYRKTLAAILTAAMTVTLLAGCGNSQPQDSGVGTQEQTKVSEESSQSRQSESRTQEEQPENDGDEFVQTWPDGQKIRWFVRGSNKIGRAHV